jgi:NAD(P)-dependent dehydrogenase (short-subunit alcohol dehydrogenase family)
MGRPMSSGPPKGWDDGRGPSAPTQDVAYCAVALAADDAGYLTGQILHPSGGWVMG